MKILMCSTFLPPFAGGAENMTIDLASSLKNKGFEVHLLTTSNSKINYFNVYRLRYMKGLTIYYSLFNKRIKHIIGQNNFDIIHNQMVLPWGFVMKQFSKKMVVTCHGSDVYPKKNFISKQLIKKSLNKTSKVISPSKWLKDFIEKEYDAPTVNIPNGIDLNLFKPCIKKKKNVILFVGRYIKLKGIENIINTAKSLKEYEFWFVGSGPLEHKINLPNTKNFGKLSRRVLPLIYSQASFSILPSERENFPLVALESMACGTPVISTELGFSEIIDHMENGIILKEGSSEKIKEAIKLIEDRNLYKRFQKNARIKILKNFSNELMVNSYIRIYKEVLE